MKKRLIMLLCCSCLSTGALASSSSFNVASDTEIKLEGFFGFQFGYNFNQNNLSQPVQHVSMTDNKKNGGLATDAAFSVTATQNINDVTAGAKIVLLTTNKPKTASSLNGSYLFLESDYGKVEAGSPYDAGNKMRVSAAKIAAAGCGFGWGKYAILDDKKLQYKEMNPMFETLGMFYMESYGNAIDNVAKGTESSRKVSYYTPKVEGFQFGISYIPDSANVGGNYSIKNIDSKTGLSKSKTGITEIELPEVNGKKGNKIILNQNIINGVSLGITYKYELLDDVSVEVGVTGEYGKHAKDLVMLDPDGKVKSTSKLSDLGAYNLGAIFTYGNISCAASYGSLGKSLTSKDFHKVDRDTRFYNGAIAYGQGPVKTSVSYYRSLKYKNTIDAISLGTEYKITQGLVPYAEISYFQAKGKPVYYVEAPKTKTRGTVALIGAKLKF